MRSDTPLEVEVKNFILETLSLDDLTAGDIDTEAPLFGDGLGLDSVDALEIGIALKKRYGIVVDPKSDHIRNHFRSVKDLAGFIASHDGKNEAHGS